MSEEDLLDRSLRVLDEIHGSPSRSVLRYTRPERSIHDSVLNKTSKVRLRRSDISDCSVTMNAGEMARLLNTTNTGGEYSVLNDSLFNKTSKALVRLHQSDFVDCSITLNPGEISRLLDGTPNKSTGFKAVPQGSDRLYRDFLESAFFSDVHGLSGQVFDIVADFIQNCVNLLSLKYNPDSDNIIDPDIVWLENERNTWRLVYALYQNRLCSRTSADGAKKESESMEVTLSKILSEKEVVSQLYRDDNAIRECQLVVDWLEKTASDQFESAIAPQLGHFTDKTVAWENTLHQLQNEKVSYTSSRPIITNLDPDAPFRQKKPLHDLDMEDESRLLQQVFTEIRCGRLDQAHTLCYHAGQPWRAATLEGWRLHHDPNYGLSSSAEKLQVEGNPQRDIWKLCAWRLADDVRAPLMARAVHGVLCGHLQSLTAVCKGWEDLLWAYTKVLVDVRVEQEIRACCCMKEYVPMPENYWNHKLNIEEIFTELEASNDPHVSCEAVKPERMVQKLLILDRIPELMSQMGEWIQSDYCKPQFVRFLAHLVLVLRLVGESHLEDVGDEILKAYVKILVSQRDPELVAHYVATLPQENQVNVFASYLETVTDPEERHLCLKAAEAVELQVEAITQRVVENIRNKTAEQQAVLSLLGETTEEDLSKVSALDWVVFYPQQRTEALWQANALIRSFLTLNKLDAARMAFNKIPSDSIELIASQCHIESRMQTDEHDYQNMPVKVAASIREYLCHKAYLDAQEGFSDWFHHYHNARPVVPVKPGGSATFTEKVAYDHRMVQYNGELERWKAAMAHQTKCVKAQLYNVLVFPDGGWMVDAEAEDQLRQQQMKSLRNLCLPKVILLLHTVLQSSGEYGECMKLADLVVSEQYELYKVYSRQQLGELLTKLSETSLSLLDNKKDPWGYAISS
ncbi:nuclear pore complex protein Nup107 [Lycorma delicatula]|uniref:nuclear pore complex protein Nup107 n=1 Tax=Lycorma delicatula TaxID=130591 RepID=UPI003F51A98A